MHPKLLVNRERTNGIYCHCSVKGAATAFHFHSHMELYLVEAGEVDVWINQKRRKLHRGELAVILSYDAHQYEPSPDAVTSCLIVPANICSELNAKALGNPFISNAGLFDEILKCCRIISQRRNPLLTDGCIRVAFGLLLETLEFSQREASAAPEKVTPVLLYLHDHFRSRISLSSAASALGFNPSYLSRCFKDSLGVGFNQYLTMLRLREAVFLLSQGNAVDFCAFESGFNSVRTFYRAFFNEFGCTPKEYMKNGQV